MRSSNLRVGYMRIFYHIFIHQAAYISAHKHNTLAPAAGSLITTINIFTIDCQPNSTFNFR